MTLPNKRPILLPTNRELKALGWMLLGAWVALGIRELLSHTPLNRTAVEAQRVAAMAPLDLGVHKRAGDRWVRQYAGKPRRSYGDGGVL